MKHSDLVYSSPNTFTTAQRISLSLSSMAIASAFRAVACTCRVEFRNRSIFDDTMRTYGRVLVAFWHESLGLSMWCYRGRGYHTLTSFSYDGELAARVVQRFGSFALRGSSSRGGWNALNQMTRALELRETLGFTLDGPRGPRRVAKPGIALLSRRSDIPVIPNAITVVPAWRMRSWDQFMVPKPRGRIICAYGAPVSPPTTEPGSIERTRKEIEERLNALHSEIEDETG